MKSGLSIAHSKKARLTIFWRQLIVLSLLCVAAIFLGGCDRQHTSDRAPSAREFPLPDRPVSPITGNEYSTEAKRDKAGEAQEIMDRSGVGPGMTVADIGAGNGYYTVRLAERVGRNGRVLAQDIDPAAIRTLGERIAREQIDNVSIVTGTAADPRLPTESFDRIFLVHMYHEVTEPYAFLWTMIPALKKGGAIIVVETDRPTGRHGIPPRLLSCEFRAVGLKLTEYIVRPELGGYYARFEQIGTRPDPSAIKPCSNL